ncbi:hypothetical protein [Nocardia colli]|uniref:hypothetical protein n=1 Tax=Nocardia colli TaxID=2545717 RepID=UPI0035DA5BE8
MSNIAVIRLSRNQSAMRCRSSTDSGRSYRARCHAKSALHFTVADRLNSVPGGDDMRARRGLAKVGIVGVVATAGIASGQCFAAAETVPQGAGAVSKSIAAAGFIHDAAAVAPWDNVGQGRGTDFEPGTNGTLSTNVIDPDYFALVDQRRRELLAAATIDGAVDGAAIGGIGGAATGAAVGAITGVGTGLATVPIGAGIGAAVGAGVGLVAGPLIGAVVGMAGGCLVGAPALLVGCIPGAIIGGTIVGFVGTIAGPIVGSLAGAAIGGGIGAGVATAAGLGAAAVGAPLGAAIGAGLGAAIGAGTAASEANQALAQQNLNDLEGFAYDQRHETNAPAPVDPIASSVQDGLNNINAFVTTLNDQFQLVK